MKFLLASILLLLVAACIELPTPTPVATPTPLLTIEITQLKAAYDTNQISADQTFKGQSLRVTGATIDNISRTIWGTPYLSLEAGGAFDFWSLQCLFKDENDLADLVRGQQITIKGINDGMSLGIVKFKDCTVEDMHSPSSAVLAKSPDELISIDSTQLPPTFEVTVDSLIQDLAANSNVWSTPASKRKYVGKPGLITGVFESVGYSIQGTSAVHTLNLGPTDPALPGLVVQCEIPKESPNAEALYLLQPGEIVTVRGTIARSYWMLLFVEACSLVSP